MTATPSPRSPRTTRWAAGLATTLLLATAGCAGSTSQDDVASNQASRRAGSATRSASADATPRTPRVGECYALAYSAATAATSQAGPVPCDQPHTAQTAYVGTIDPYEDGHLLAVDSDGVQQRIAQTCPGRVDRYVGGGREDRRVSRVRAIWFSPTLEQADAGATWFRCDAVAVRSEDALATLPARMRGALGTPRGDRLATCGTAAPDKKAFERVTCEERHSWRAVTSIDLPQRAAYLGRAAGKDADASCQQQAADRADDPLQYTWSFQWPTRQDWDSGQRWGLCWVPDRA